MKVESFEVTFGKNSQDDSYVNKDKISVYYEIIDGLLIAHVEATLKRFTGRGSSVAYESESEKIIIIGKTNMTAVPKSSAIYIPVKTGELWTLIKSIIFINDGFVSVTDVTKAEGFAKTYFHTIPLDQKCEQSSKNFNLFTKNSRGALLLYLNENEEGYFPDFNSDEEYDSDEESDSESD